MAMNVCGAFAAIIMIMMIVQKQANAHRPREKDRFCASVGVDDD